MRLLSFLAFLLGIASLQAVEPSVATKTTAQYLINSGGGTIGNARTWYVDPTGSPSGDGTLLRPYSNPTSACAVAQSGDIVYMAAGTYTISNSIAIPANGALVGAGSNLVTISSWVPFVWSGPSVQPRDNSYAAGFKILLNLARANVTTNSVYTNANSFYSATWGNTAIAGASRSATNYICESVVHDGVTDCHYNRNTNPCSGSFISCVFTSKWDCLALMEGSHKFSYYYSDFRAVGPNLISPVSEVLYTESPGNSFSNAPMLTSFYFCNLFATNANSHVMGFSTGGGIGDTNGVVTMYGCTSTNNGGVTPVGSAYLFSAVSNRVFSFNSVFNTNDFVRDDVSIATGFNTNLFTTNPVSTGAAGPKSVAIANNAARVRAIAVVSGSQTPWTSDIDGGGFQLANTSKITVNGSSGGTITLDVNGDITTTGDISSSGGLNALNITGNSTFTQGANFGGGLIVAGPQTNNNLLTLVSASASGDINFSAVSQVYHLGAGNGVSAYLGAGLNNAGALNIVSTMNMWSPIQFNTDNAFDIGASGANRPKNVYVAGTVSATGVTIFGTNNTGSLSASISTNLSGKVRFASGTQTYVITDAKVVNTMGAYATVNTTNATSISCQAFPGTGVLTLKLNAAASADCDVSWWVNPMQ